MIQTAVYSIDVIKDEARHLVCEGAVCRHQPIYTLCQYFSARDWEWVECQLEEHDFLLRDQILDLIGFEDWQED